MSHGYPPQQATGGSMFKLTILGDGGVGKTALVIQLCLNRFVETYDPTIEDSYRKRILLDGHPTTLEIMDTAGQDEYSSLRDQWIRDGEGFLMVYSITQRGSFERTQEYYEQIVRIKDGEPFGLVLVGNKCDEEADREVSPLEGEQLAQSWGIPFFETSAKLNINADDAFLQAARITRNTRVADSPPSSRTSFDRGDSVQQSRQGSQSSTRSRYSSAHSSFAAETHTDPATGLLVGGAPHQPPPYPQQAKPPLLQQASAGSSSSTDFEPTRSFTSHSTYQQSAPPPRAQPAASINDSDGADTIVARPRHRKKKGKCAVM